MTILLELSVGALAALGFVSVARRLPPRQELRLYVVGLLMAALTYVAFALLAGEPHDLWVEMLGVALFGTLAAQAWRGSALLAGLGWAAHVVWDVALHRPGVEGYAPHWYSAACIGFDLLLAAYIVVWLPRRSGASAESTV